MSAIILDGKELSKISEESIKERVSKLSEKGIKPTLATVLVGNDPASETYVKMKRNTVPGLVWSQLLLSYLRLLRQKSF